MQWPSQQQPDNGRAAAAQHEQRERTLKVASSAVQAVAVQAVHEMPNMLQEGECSRVAAWWAVVVPLMSCTRVPKMHSTARNRTLRWRL